MSTKKISEIRRENMEALFERFKKYVWVRFPKDPEHGMMAKFARTIPKKDGGGAEDITRYMSHVWAGRKQIGHGLARRIEQGVKELGTEFDDVVDGWLDNDHSRRPAMSAEVESLMAIVQTCYDISSLETQLAINELKRRLEQVAK